MKPYVRVLLAEDRAEEVELLVESFQSLGGDPPVEIEVATDGDNVLSALTSRPSGFDLIVLDANLPIRSAQGVLAELRAKGIAPAAPVVVISSMISNSARQELLDLGAAAVDQKPMDLDAYESLAKQMIQIALDRRA